MALCARGTSPHFTLVNYSSLEACVEECCVYFPTSFRCKIFHNNGVEIYHKIRLHRMRSRVQFNLIHKDACNRKDFNDSYMSMFCFWKTTKVHAIHTQIINKLSMIKIWYFRKLQDLTCKRKSAFTWSWNQLIRDVCHDIPQRNPTSYKVLEPLSMV